MGRYNVLKELADDKISILQKIVKVKSLDGDVSLTRQQCENLPWFIAHQLLGLQWCSNCGFPQLLTIICEEQAVMTKYRCGQRVHMLKTTQPNRESSVLTKEYEQWI